VFSSPPEQYHNKTPDQTYIRDSRITGREYIKLLKEKEQEKQYHLKAIHLCYSFIYL
jgi:hypothetical protein